MQKAKKRLVERSASVSGTREEAKRREETD